MGRKSGCRWPGVRVIYSHAFGLQRSVRHRARQATGLLGTWSPPFGGFIGSTAAIVKAVAPMRIILFGSAARGEMRAKSDLDVLVVIADGQHRGHAAEAIYCAKPRRTRPLDLVVATESDVEHQHDAPWYVIAPALREGRVLYDRTTQA